MSASLISVIGPPASGKTTLAERLAAGLDARLIHEDFAGNPFLADAYKGRRDLDLVSQLYFLLSRIGQLSIARWPGEGLVVSDYGFCQDRVFASIRLSAEEFAAYEKVAQPVRELVHPPEVLVILDADPDVLLERIARRGRDFEQSMDREFLSAMRRAYAAPTLAGRRGTLRIDADEIDFRQRRASEPIVREVRDLLA